MKGFVVGVLVGVLLFAGGLYYYFVSGTAPAAVADPPMLMERKMASRSLDAHIDKANVPAPPIQPSEDNYVAAAKLYKDQCAGCHGLPDQTASRDRRQYVSRRDADVQGQGRDGRSAAGELLEGKKWNPVDRNAHFQGHIGRHANVATGAARCQRGQDSGLGQESLGS